MEQHKDNKETRRAQEDSEVREQRTSEDWERAGLRRGEDEASVERFSKDPAAEDWEPQARIDAVLPPRMPTWKRLIYGVLQGILISVVVIAMLIGLNRITGGSPLEKQIVADIERLIEEQAASSKARDRVALQIAQQIRRRAERMERLTRELFELHDPATAQTLNNTIQDTNDRGRTRPPRRDRPGPRPPSRPTPPAPPPSPPPVICLPAVGCI